MITVIMVIHILITAAMVGIILLQRNEGGGLGMGSNASGFMTARGTANLLTRVTAILVTGFFATSILLAILSRETGRPASIVDTPLEGPTTATKTQ